MELYLKKHDFHVFTIFGPVADVLRREHRVNVSVLGDFERGSPVRTLLTTKEGIYHMVEQIDSKMREGKRVVVCCGAGAEISPHIAGIYLVIKRGLSIQEAAMAVKHWDSSAKLLEADIAASATKYKSHSKQLAFEKKSKRSQRKPLSRKPSGRRRK